MMTDTIADMLTRIRNAASARHERTTVPFSKLKFALAKILEREGYVLSVEQASDSGKPSIDIKLKYDVSKKPAITSIKRISTPGRRVYKSVSEIPHVLNNYGISIISTPAGLMTNREAKKNNVGGEIVCEVY
jgi:small subunit ribosomal protein S8